MIKDILNHKSVHSFSINDNGNCVLSLSGGYNLSTECLVRFIGGNNFICNSDHGQKFGLAVPFNAESKINEAIAKQQVTDIKFDNYTGDLEIYFPTGILQIICNSAGYENYQLNGPDELLIVVHGGKQ